MVNLGIICLKHINVFKLGALFLSLSFKSVSFSGKRPVHLVLLCELVCV